MPSRRIEESFIRLYEKECTPLFRHCSFRLFSRERAREIAQEAFCRVWSELVEGKNIRHLRGFLYRIANNMIVDEVRKKKEQSLEFLQEAGFEPSNDGGMQRAGQKLDEERAMAVLHDMEEDIRQVLILRYINGFRPKEIAGILGISQDLVSVRIHRGKKMLRERFYLPTTKS